MHVGCGEGNVAEGGGAESSHVAGVVGDFVESGVVGGIGSLAVEVVESGVVEGDFLEGEAFMLDGVGEVDAAVAVEAF